MKLEMKETATEFLFFVNNEPAARIKKQTDLQSVGMKTEVWQLKKGQLEHFLHFR